MNSGLILVVPTVEKNRGGGHLIRSVSMVRSLRGAGREAFLFLPEFSGESAADFHPRKLQTAGMMDVAGLKGESWILQGKTQDPRYVRQPENHWDFIILDKFRTDLWEAASWAALAPLIGIDEGGAYRDRFDFLIDLLPPLPRRGLNPPNIASPSLIPLPRNRRPSFRTPEGGPLPVLISFGAEDTAGLTSQAAMALGRQARPGELEITVIAPGLPEDKAQALRASAPGITVLTMIPNLREHLAEYGLLITHFGLSAFEALHARLPVLLVSPGSYHEKLARHAGFFSAGAGPAAASRIGQFLFSGKNGRGLNTKFLSTLAEDSAALAARHGLDAAPRDLGEVLAAFTPFPRTCPACGAPFFVRDKSREIPIRFPGRTFRRCTHCGMIYVLRTSPPVIEYETDYFFDFYKRQYGKTYLEDFPNLAKAGKRRLKVITRLIKPGRGGQPGDGRNRGNRLLDIGCAYGPFLSAARDEGFSVQGIDPAADAVRYVQEELGIPARRSVFPDISLELPEHAGSFEVITLWYVIEHFEDLRWVLVEINRLLAVRGALAFSTPSFSGISGKKSLAAFLEKSPPDHRTIWRPAICRRLLSRYGFRLKKIRVTGHHPERFPFGNQIKRGGFLWNLLLCISRLFRLGDTFECYAQKVRSLW
jgi:2-polyprenyl-3-methyl-5-hydroxy-6-metoxy-1,4-benzoquinol methylase